MDIILDAVARHEWEMDLAWVVKGGEDPIAWMKKLRQPHQRRSTSRTSRRQARRPMKTAGPMSATGTLDWKQLIADVKAKTKARYCVMEHDKPSDVDRFAIALDRRRQRLEIRSNPMDIGFSSSAPATTRLPTCSRRSPRSATRHVEGYGALYTDPAGG